MSRGFDSHPGFQINRVKCCGRILVLETSSSGSIPGTLTKQWGGGVMAAPEAVSFVARVRSSDVPPISLVDFTTRSIAHCGARLR